MKVLEPPTMTIAFRKLISKRKSLRRAKGSRPKKSALAVQRDFQGTGKSSTGIVLCKRLGLRALLNGFHFLSSVGLEYSLHTLHSLQRVDLTAWLSGSLAEQRGK